MKNFWQKRKNKWNINKHFVKFCKDECLKSLKTISNYPQYYAKFDTVSFSYSDEHEPVEMIPVTNVLELVGHYKNILKILSNFEAF